MKCNGKIIIIIILTTLILYALYTTQDMQVSPSTSLILKSFIRFKKTKKPHCNLSPSPSPSPSLSPSLSPSPTPLRHHHSHRQNRHHLPPPVPFLDQSDDENIMLIAVVLVTVCSALCIISLIILCVWLLKKLSDKRKRKKKSFSKNTKGETYSDPPLVNFAKHCSKDHDRLNHLEENNAKHEVLTIRNILSDKQVEYHNGSIQSTNYETLVSSKSTLPRYAPSSSSTTFLLDSSSFSTEFDSYLESNRTLSVKTPTPCQPTQPASNANEGTPLPILKPLHWDKVRAAPDHSMVGDKLKSCSLEIDETQNRFDEELIESLFRHNLNNKEELKNKSPSLGKHVLVPKRLHNLTILFKALNATTEQVCRALAQGSGLNQQQLEILIKMEPTKEEEAMIMGSKGEDLGSAETFIATILTIPYAFLRVEALLYRETFEDEVTHLRTTFLVLEEACKELRSSRLFLKLLEAVLKMGNRINVGTKREGAKEFKLGALLKLAHVKGTDGKTTLLHFVVQEIVRSEGIQASESIIGKINRKNHKRNIQDREDEYRNMGLELVGGLSTELCNVKKTATIDFLVIRSSVANLSQGMGRLRTLVYEDLNLNESIKSFFSYVVKQLKELKDDEHKVLELVKQTTIYFHGSMSKDHKNPLWIFVIVRDFLTMLDRVCRDLRRSKGFTNHNSIEGF